MVELLLIWKGERADITLFLMYREKKNQIKRPKTEMILNISRRDIAKHTITELYCFQQLLKTYQWAMVLQWGIFFPHSLTQFILTQSHVCHPVAAIKNSLVCINKPLKLFHRNVPFSPVWITFFCTIKDFYCTCDLVLKIYIISEKTVGFRHDAGFGSSQKNT